MKLYRNTGKPLYKQLKQVLKHNIQKGTYLPGRALPGERQLMELFGVSRMTVRNAISELVQESVLVKRHGSGTFVNPKTTERLFLNLYGLVEELRLSGQDISIELVSSKTKPAGKRAREELKLDHGETVFNYKRLIRANGEPILFTNSNITSSLSEVYKSISLNIASDVIYEHLETCGYSVTDARQKILSGFPNKEEAEYLNCDTNTPLLILYRTTYLDGDRPIIFSRAVYGKQYSFNLDLKRHSYPSDG